MTEQFTIEDLHDIHAGMSAQSIVLRALLKANPGLARQIRDFALDYDSLSRGIEARSARVMQEDLLQLTSFLDG